MTRTDIRESVTDQIKTYLKQGVRPWTMPWDQLSTGQRPLRSNGTPYRGMNVILLWMESMEKHYRSSYWMTFKQARNAKAYVRKGEKATPIIFYKSYNPASDDDASEDDDIERFGIEIVCAHLDLLGFNPADDTSPEPNAAHMAASQDDPAMPDFYDEIPF